MYKPIKWQTKNDFIRDYVTDMVKIYAIWEKKRDQLVEIKKPNYIDVCFQTTLMSNIKKIETYKKDKIQRTDVILSSTAHYGFDYFILKWPHEPAGMVEKERFDIAISQYIDNTYGLKELADFLEKLNFQPEKYTDDESMVRQLKGDESELLADVTRGLRRTGHGDGCYRRIDTILENLNDEIDRAVYDRNYINYDDETKSIEPGLTMGDDAKANILLDFAIDARRKIKMVVYSYREYQKGLEK